MYSWAVQAMYYYTLLNLYFTTNKRNQSYSSVVLRIAFVCAVAAATKEKRFTLRDCIIGGRKDLNAHIWGESHRFHRHLLTRPSRESYRNMRKKALSRHPDTRTRTCTPINTNYYIYIIHLSSKYNSSKYLRLG